MIAVVRFDSRGFGGLGYGQATCGASAALVVTHQGLLAFETYCNNDVVSSRLGLGQGWMVFSVVSNTSDLSMWKDSEALVQNHPLPETMATVTGQVWMGGEVRLLERRPWLLA